MKGVVLFKKLEIISISGLKSFFEARILHSQIIQTLQLLSSSSAIERASLAWFLVIFFASIQCEYQVIYIIDNLGAHARNSRL